MTLPVLQPVYDLATDAASISQALRQLELGIEQEIADRIAGDQGQGGGPPSFASITGKPTTLGGYGITDGQPLNTDLTSIAGQSNTSFGLGLLTQANGAAVAAYIGVGANPNNTPPIGGQFLTAFNSSTGSFTQSVLPALNLIPAPSADVSLASHKLTNLLAPVAATDGANKAYVDATAVGQLQKAPVAFATTGNIALTGNQTVDGQATGTSRGLVKDQTTATENGIYVAAAGAWARATDADTGAELVKASVFVQNGTINGGTSWNQITPATITIGATDIVFVQTGANTVYSATGGISQAGNQFSLSTMAATTLKGNNTGGTAAPIDLTISQAKTMLDLNLVENTALSTWAGSGNITSVGTVASGTWNGSPVGIPAGGTNASSANAALNNLLPVQTGHAGQNLYTDGANASWQLIPNSVFVNVKSAPFNAVGDGVADDTAAINSAAASMASGGVCYFPAGTFKVGTAGAGLTIANNVRFMGNGKGATVLKLNHNLANSSAGVFQGTNKNFWSIHDMTIDLNGFVGTGVTPITCNHWSVYNTEIINITNNQIDGLSNGYGIFVNGGQFWSIRNNYIHKSISDGHFQNQSIICSDASGDVSYFDIANNININTGILVQGHDGSIVGNKVKGCGYGAGIATGGGNHSFRILIADNNCSFGNPGVADRNATRISGFQIWGSSHTIRGNIAHHNDEGGLSIICSNSTVIGNIAYDNGILANGSGITAIYAPGSPSPGNANGTTFVGNRSYNTLGASGTQNYGYEESNNSLLRGIVNIGNNWNTNRLGTTKIFSPFNGANDAGPATSAVWAPGTIANGASISTNTTLGQAAMGDLVLPAISTSLIGCSICSGVSAAGTITTTITNNTGAAKTFPSLTLYLRVIKQMNAANY